MKAGNKSMTLMAATAWALMALTCAATLIDTYPDPDQMYQEIKALAGRDPDRVKLIEYGKSVQDRPLLALRFHRGDGAARPGALVAGNIHGEEWIGNRTAMAVAQRLAAGIDSDPLVSSLLQNMDLYVIPCVNPDGYYHTWESNGRDKLGQMRKNANGVDLNRNFPPPGRKKAGAQNKPDSTGYPGPEPLSEPETKEVVDFVLARDIFATVDYHSVVGQVITPACKSGQCFSRFLKMGGAYVKNQGGAPYMLIVPPGPMLETPGMMEPHLYYQYGVMSILIELGFQPVNVVNNRSIKTFELFNPRDPERLAQNQVEATLRALETAYELTGGKRVPESER